MALSRVLCALTLVEIDVTPERLRLYIHEAVVAWGSQLHPNDPLWALSEDTVRVVEASAG